VGADLPLEAFDLARQGCALVFGGHDAAGTGGG